MRDVIEQDLINVSEVLRESYLPIFKNAVNTEASPFLQKIKKKPLTAEKAVSGSRIGIDGGFGMSAERFNTPEANAPIYSAFTATSKDAYVEMHISQKALLLARSAPQSMVDALVDQVEASKEAAIWNTGRMLFGDGTGVLAKVVGGDTGTNTIEVDDLTNLIVGLSIDIYDNGASTPSEAALQIRGIDFNTKTLTLSKNLTKAHTTGFITTQNSYKREITGLKSIFDPTVTHIYGLEKAKNPILVPYTKDAGGDIDDMTISAAVSTAYRRSQAKIDMILCGEAAFRAYEEYMHSSQHVVVEKQKYVGGAVGYKVVTGKQETEIVMEPFVPANKMWGVDTSAFELHETGWDFATHKSSVFNLMPGTAVYRALLANYMELICRHPGGCIEITNAANA